MDSSDIKLILIGGMLLSMGLFSLLGIYGIVLLVPLISLLFIVASKL